MLMIVAAMIMLLMAPGPASNGMLRGTMAMASRSAAACASSSVCRIPLCFACIMEMAISSSKMPPPV